jgi:hypothetical protein
MPLTLKRLLPVLLLAGDLLALIAFVYIGQRDHELIDPVNPVLGVLITTLEFAAPWLIAGLWLGAFPQAEALSARAFMSRTFNTWLVAAPLGILVRAYVLGRAVVPTVFILATLGFGGLFVIGWRAGFILIWKWLSLRQAARRESEPRPATQ